MSNSIGKHAALLKSASSLSTQCMELVKQIECEDISNSEDVFKVLEEMEELDESRYRIMNNFDLQKDALQVVKKKLAKSWEDNVSNSNEKSSENTFDIDKVFAQTVKSLEEKKLAEASTKTIECDNNTNNGNMLDTSVSKSLENSLNLSASVIDTVESKMEELFSNVDM